MIKFPNLTAETVACFKALIIQLAITAIWYYFEYKQFHELQWDRKGDNIVSVLYFIVIWYLIYKIEKGGR